MISNVSGTAITQPMVQSASTNQPSTQTKTQPIPTDTVQLSSASQSALQAATQEASETAVQTAKEAAAGDIQAQRLLAQQAAAKAEKGGLSGITPQD